MKAIVTPVKTGSRLARALLLIGALCLAYRTYAWLDARYAQYRAGKLLDDAASARAGEPLLTLVTCYPFFYVGSAPERFIVRARRSDPAATAITGSGG